VLRQKAFAWAAFFFAAPPDVWGLVRATSHPIRRAG